MDLLIDQFLLLYGSCINGIPVDQIGKAQLVVSRKII